MEPSKEEPVKLSESAAGIMALEEYITLNQKRGVTEQVSMQRLKDLYGVADVMEITEASMQNALESLKARFKYERQGSVTEIKKKFPKAKDYLEQGEFVYFGDGWVIKTRWQELLHHRKLVRKSKHNQIVFVQKGPRFLFSPDAIISYLIGKEDRLVTVEEERIERARRLSKKHQKRAEFESVFKT